jgi:hypothetical protein
MPPLLALSKIPIPLPGWQEKSLHAADESNVRFRTEQVGIVLYPIFGV